MRYSGTQPRRTTKTELSEAIRKIEEAWTRYIYDDDDDPWSVGQAIAAAAELRRHV